MLTRSDPNRPLEAACFYASRRGQRFATLLSERLRPLLPDPARQRVLGLGYAQPLMNLWPGLERAQWACSARFETILTHRPPVPATGHRFHDLVVAPDALPFDDLTLDTVLIVHGLELTANVPMLRAVWKALKDDGTLVLVVPNRTGFLAHDDSTPFGHGTPYSAGQLDRLLTRALFHTETATTALSAPPLALRLKLGLARRATSVWDRASHLFGRRPGGLHVVIARKDIYAALPFQPEAATRPLGRQITEMTHATTHATQRTSLTTHTGIVRLPPCP